MRTGRYTEPSPTPLAEEPKPSTVSSTDRISSTVPPRGLYLVLFSVHGLIRGEDAELGRDADTGGQVTYVLELARALAAHESVERVDLITRRIEDRRVGGDYAEPEEELAPGARLVRLRFGPRRYLRKETLWPHLDGLVRAALAHFRRVGRLPDVLHGHYADGAEVGRRLGRVLGVPLVVTGHSLGRVKRERLLEKGADPDRIEARYHFERRVRAEEAALAAADLVVTSTAQEIERQWGLYDAHDPDKMAVIPPGVELDRFHPAPAGEEWTEPPIAAEIDRFLRHPERPMLLAIARPDPRKNVETLIRAYAGSPELQERANLVLVLGNRDDVVELERGPRRVLLEVLHAIDLYDLYGRVAYPKHHRPDDVPDLYRLAAARGGVLVNPALTEPFGLTLIEAAASGLPVVATHDGGPREVVGALDNGVLVDPLDEEALAAALLSAVGDRDRWRRRAESGIEGAHRRYTWSGHVRAYLDELGPVLAAADRDPERPPRPLFTADGLLVVDLDDTLFGDRASLSRLLARLSENRERIGFVIATGRRLDSAAAALEEWGVPAPDVWITSVGARIHYGPNDGPINGAGPVEDEGWRRHLDHRWDRAAVVRALDDLPGLRLQPESEQLPEKVSYDLDDDRRPDLGEVRRRLREAGVAVTVVYSHGTYLDLLPERASKGHALDWVLATWGIEVEPRVVAGNSGNDAEMLLRGAPAVVVGNHGPELEPLRGEDGVYFADGHCAAGVLEGAERAGLFARPEAADEPPDRRREGRADRR